MMPSRSLPSRPLARRSFATLAAIAVGSSTLLLTATAASATTIDDPGVLIEGSIGSFTGTCVDSPLVEFSPSWFHDIDDTLNGPLATEAAYELAADASIDTEALGIVSSSTADASLTNTVEWEAYGLDGDFRFGIVSGTATAQVTVSAEPTTTTTAATPSTTVAPVHGLIRSRIMD